MTTKIGLSLSMGWLLAVLVAPVATAQSAKTAVLSDKEVIELVQNAKTPADHEKLAAYYDQTAVDLADKAKTHRELAAVYRRMPPSGNPRIVAPTLPVTHCENIATSAAKGAEEARAMAEHHRMLAKEPSAKRR